MKFNNTYYVLRHGEALSNVKNVYSCWPEKFRNPLTKKGQGQIKKAAQLLKSQARHGKGIDMIFASDLMRTKQTAGIVGKALKVPVKTDKRLREAAFGTFNGAAATNLYYAKLNKGENSGRESYGSIAKRMYSFLKEIDKKYKGKNILIVSHQAPLWAIENKVKGISLDKATQLALEHARITRGELRKIN